MPGNGGDGEKVEGERCFSSPLPFSVHVCEAGVQFTKRLGSVETKFVLGTLICKCVTHSLTHSGVDTLRN